MDRVSFAWLVWALLHINATAFADGSVSKDLLHANFTPYHATTNAPILSVITTVLEPMNTPLDTRDRPITNDGMDINGLDASRPAATPLADHPTGGIARPEEDASSKIQAIFFGIAGTCIGVASLAVALLTLRAMSKQRQPDPETPPPRERDRSNPGEMELTQHPSSIASEQTLELSIELDAVETAVDVQCEEPASRNFNVQATQQPSSTTAVTG